MQLPPSTRQWHLHHAEDLRSHREFGCPTVCGMGASPPQARDLRPCRRRRCFEGSFDTSSAAGGGSDSRQLPRLVFLAGTLGSAPTIHLHPTKFDPGTLLGQRGRRVKIMPRDFFSSLDVLARTESYNNTAAHLRDTRHLRSETLALVTCSGPGHASGHTARVSISTKRSATRRPFSPGDSLARVVCRTV